MSKTKQSTSAFVQKPSVLATGFALTLMMAQSAYAQQPAAAAKKDEKVDKIEVTGTRIPPPNLEGASPVTVIDAAAIKVDGLVQVENLLNNLPQVFAAQGSNISNGATGTATVNLRGLGTARTLVLVNGRRLPPGSPRIWAADLNQIPAALVKRVEILTGGASSVYGSDAVAGVVNFIMNDKFEGVQIDLNQSGYNHEQGSSVSSIVAGRAATNPAQFKVPSDKSFDGKIFDMSLTLGSSFDGGRGHAVAFMGYQKADALLQSERDYSACALGSNAAGFVCGGSGTNATGNFIPLSGGLGSFTIADSNGTTRAFNGSLDQYNYGPLNFFQRPAERHTFSAFAHYDVNDKARVYTEFNFHDDRSVAQIAPSGIFGQIATVSFDNPLLTAASRAALGLTATGQTRDVLILRRNVEGGPRQDDIRHTSYRGVAGIKGELVKNWDYDLYAQRGEVIYQSTYKNEFSVERTLRALDVVRDPTTGAAVCRSATNGTDASCVPFNLWRLGGITPAQLAYIQGQGFQRGFTSQSIVGASLSSDLGYLGWKMPGAKNGVGVAFGAERRSDQLELDTDRSFETGDLAGQGGPTIDVGGKIKVKEIFAEARLPIMEGQPMADYLNLTASVRRSDYNTGVTTDTWGLGLEYAPVKDYRFRGSVSRAVRAPNVVELFAAQGLGLYDNDNDPCAGPTPLRSLADCQRTGVTAAQYGNIPDNPAGQYNALFGGNPNLKPEKADTFTLGLVATPFKNFSATLDYFKVEVDDVVGTVAPTIILQQCLDTGSPTFCGLITRDQIGSLWALTQARIVSTNQNIASLKTEGYDIGANYSMKLDGGWGGLNFNLTGTYMTKSEVEPLKGLGKYDCVGLYGPSCGTPTPEWRHKFRATWNTPWNLDVSLTWRYFDAVLLDRTSSNPLIRGTVNPVDRELAQQNYLDLSAAYTINKMFTVRAGVNNLTDRDPPLSAQVGAGFGNGNTYPQVYDAVGRRIFVNFTAKF